ncbi:Uncharacterized conserved protein YfaS, alpha-2-macroglobulin family [Brevinema andersonii]|uniref:Uncharacterized conserved protein YfaS, alpha-2-macroglobulin family n=1 Tax=Brevinema andersonii TaxID=34097 RepID=A0A1I1EE45_BREAD|nr:MG2 domain-containing protein [Brevinema andersonii]SFB83598.1 Uncharacterized conserved protein YfaS, alpha-2-macroglobulin family [Brevinema andersonii]
MKKKIFSFFYLYYKYIILFFSLNISLLTIYVGYKHFTQKEDWDKILLNYGTREITFQFDQDIINPSSYEQAIETWQTKLGLDFEPPLSGSIRTINNKSFIYTLHTPIPPNKSVKIISSNIAASIHDKSINLKINGHSVNELPYTLPAKQFQILYAQRIKKDLKSPLTLSINMPIDLKKLKKSLVILDNSQKIPYRLHYQETTNFIPGNNSISTDFQKIVVTIKHLKPNTRYTIIHSNNGLVSFQDEFSTYSLPTWKGISSDPFEIYQDFTIEKEIWLQSSNPLKETQNKNSLLQIVPLVPEVDYTISNSNILITGSFQANTSYTITFIPKNIKDIYNQKLTDIFTTNLFIKHADPGIKYPLGIILLNKKNPIIPIETINISNLTVKFQVIRSDYYIARTLQNNEVAVPIQTTNIILDTVPDKMQKFNFDLNTITNNQSGLIQISFHNAELKESPPVLKVILSSSLLTAYTSFNNLVFYARDIETQAPLADMTIMIYDKERGSYQDLGRTGSDGLLRVPKPNLSLALLEEPLFIGILNNDITFAGYGSTFKDSFTQPYYYSAQVFDGDIAYPLTIKNMIFTDKSSYNAGESVNIHAIARDYDNGILSTKSSFFKSNITITILDPEDKELTNITKKWTEFGSFNVSYPLENTAPIGNYRVIAKSRAKQPPFYSETYFKVDTAEPTPIDLSIQLNTNIYYYGDLLNFSITTSDFLNSPIDMPISYEASMNTAPYFSSIYPDYTFNEYDFPSKTEILIKQKKNSRNNIVFSKKLKQFRSNNGYLTITVIAHPTNMPAITNTTNDIPILLPLQLGLKPQYYNLPVLQTNTFYMLALNTVNQQLASNIKAKFYIEYYAYNDDKQNILQKIFFFFKRKIIYNKKIKLGNDKIEFIPTKPGRYVAHLQAKYKKNNIHSSVNFEVYNQEEINDITSKKLTMHLDKPKYNSGEKAILSVINPYSKSRLLLFLERKNTIETRSIESTNSLISTEIPLTIDDEPNIIISALLISLEPKNVDPLYSGRLSLAINPRHQELLINIGTEKPKYTPGEKVRLELDAINYANIRVNGEAVVIVRDRSIPNFNIIPNPVDIFYNPKPFSCSLWDSGFLQNNPQPIMRPLRLADNMASTAGYIRSDIKYTAFYQGNVKLYHNKKTIVEFNLPDNITSFDITILGYDQNSLFGKTNIIISVSRSMTSDLLASKFVRIGDQPIWGTIVKNKTAEILDTEVNLENPYTNYSTNLTLLPQSQQSVLIQTLIKSNQSQTWTVQASNSKYQDGFTKEIPIIIENPWETASYSGIISNSNSIHIALDTNNLLKQQLAIQISPSPLLTIKPLITKIITNKSLYLSDIIQRIFLISSNEQLLNSLGLTDLLPTELRNIVNNDIKNLNNYIVSNKINMIPVSMFLPVPEYTILRTYHTLLHAQKSGYNIDPHLLEHFKIAADQYAQKKFSPNLSPYLQTVYQLYAWKLQTLDKSLSKDNFSLLVNNIRIDNAQIHALILDIMNILGFPSEQIKEQIEKINNEKIESVSSIIFSTNSFENNNIANTMINQTSSQYNALKIINGIDTNKINSINSYLLYAHRFGNYKQESSNYKVSLNKKPIIFQKNSAIIQLDNKNSTVCLDFENSGIPYFYSINYQRIPLKSKNFVNQGFNIEKTIYDDNKKVTNNILKIGKTYTIIIDVIPNIVKDQYIYIIDPLYATLHATSSQNQSASLYSTSIQNTAVHLSARIRNQNKIQLKYLVTPTIAGTWVAPAIQVFDKENPEMFSYKSQPPISIE